MYTGIVQGKFEVVKINRKPGLHTLYVALSPELKVGLEKGASVSVDGVCLTVAGFEDEWVFFDVMSETLRLTTLGFLHEGSLVNIERSAKSGAEIGGHLISGHVDTKASVIAIDLPENNFTMKFCIGKPWMKYIFSKGFLGINGCSLTVVNVDKSKGEFEVWLIPETLNLTTFGEKQIGDEINIEVDRQTQIIVDTISDLLKDPDFRIEHGIR
jgi:riboflavin synthase